MVKCSYFFSLQNLNSVIGTFLSRIGTFRVCLLYTQKYHELRRSSIPSAYPEGPDGPVQIKVISGKSHGVDSPVRPQGGCWYFHVIFKRKSSIFQEIREFSRHLDVYS